MKIKIFQKGFNYSQDGPGNRLVYHLQGCNMRCPWCANPEGMSKDGVMMVEAAYLLAEICPRGAVGPGILNREVCKTCVAQDCITTHRSKGIYRSCKSYEMEGLIEEVLRSKMLFYDGGGVTLSGGEATCQFEAVKMFLKALKAQGIHTTVETNGTHPKLEELFPLIDFLILDVKHYEEERHKALTGISHKEVRKNLAKLMKAQKEVLIRIPLIRGFNDAKEDAQNFVSFFKSMPKLLATFEFLPYHEYGKGKWEKCGLSYEMKEGYITKETLDDYCRLFKEKDLKVIFT